MNVLNVAVVAGGIISAAGLLFAIFGSLGRKSERERRDLEMAQFFEFVDGLSEGGQQGQAPAAPAPDRPENSGPSQMKLPIRRTNRTAPTEAKTATG